MKRAYNFDSFAKSKLNDVYKAYKLPEAFKPGEDGMPSIPTVCMLSVTDNIAVVDECVTHRYTKSPDAIARYFMYLDKISDNTLKYIVRFIKVFMFTDVPKDFSDVELKLCAQIFLLTFLMMKYNEGKNLKCDEKLNEVAIEVDRTSEDSLITYLKKDNIAYLTMLATEDPKICFNIIMTRFNNCLLDVDVTRAEMYRVKSLARYFLLAVAMAKAKEENIREARIILNTARKRLARYENTDIDKLLAEKEYLKKENVELKEKIVKFEDSSKLISELQEENLKLINLNAAYERKLSKARSATSVNVIHSTNDDSVDKDGAVNEEKVISDDELAKYNICVVATKDRVKKASWFKLADVAPSQTSPERIAGSDLVIICTSFISHPIFYRVREYCKRYNINYIYNPDQIINQDRMIESIRQSAIRGLGL